MIDDILWQETYEQLLAQGLDKYSAEVVATDMLQDLDEVSFWDFVESQESRSE